MTIYKMIEEERANFYDNSWTRGVWSLVEDIYESSHYFAYSLLPSIHRLKDILNRQELTNMRDRAEIVNHWLDNDEYHDHYPKKPLKTLDDARESVMRIDDGRIGRDTWQPEESRHPVWHTPIGIEDP